MRNKTNLINHTISIVTGVLMLATTGNLMAQGKSLSSSVGLYVYPANSQSPEQQSRDDYECYNWAQGQTGHNPVNPEPIYAQAAPTNTGPDGSILKGAAAGAIVGEIVDDDAGKGAAYGAAAGLIRGRRNKRAQAKQSQANAEAQAAQIEAQRAAEFNNAFSACLSARGYSVK